MVATGATAVTIAVHILGLPLSTSLSSALEVRRRVLSLLGKKSHGQEEPDGTAAVSPIQDQGMGHVWKEPSKVPGTSLPECWQVGETRTARGAPG